MSGRYTTAAYINYTGGIKSNNSFTSAVHIPEKCNIEADKFSRKFNKNTEWQPNP